MDGNGVSFKSPIQGSTSLVLGPLNQLEDQKYKELIWFLGMGIFGFH